ncbi:hypothetical protein AgCh_009026 [Apium graveolens]
MQDQRMLSVDETAVPKPRVKKPSTKKSKIQAEGNGVKMAQEHTKPGQKASKKGLVNDISSFQQPERSTSDSLPDSSSSGNEYRVLRRKYLLLEEESFGLESELREAENEVTDLEKEKLDLLDKLVVLEGLVDPSEFQGGYKHI